MRFFYNFLLLLSLPLYLRSRSRHRLFTPLPTNNSQEPLIWIHAASLGEAKAAGHLIRALGQRYPNVQIALSTVTNTGAMHAASLPAHYHFTLPVDLSWTMRRLVHRLNPSLMVFIESDFWPNHLKALTCPSIVVNGKLSERSYKRWKKFGALSRKWLWRHIDLFLLQDDQQKTRFEKLGAKNCQTAPNLKYAWTPKQVHPLPITSASAIITIASTHPGEEKLLLNALKKTPYTLLLAPRHPHRFEEIAEQIEIPFCRFSHIEHYAGEPLVLIDAIGELDRCFAISDIAIIGGSFVPIGGHNILEPVYAGIPVVYGPHMQAQREMVRLVEKAGVGYSTTTQTLSKDLEKVLQTPHQSRCFSLREKLSGGVEEILEKIAGEGFEPPTFGL